MTVWYNEIDPYCAEWLRNLIAAGEIPAGDVDERPIEEVTAMKGQAPSESIRFDQAVCDMSGTKPRHARAIYSWNEIGARLALAILACALHLKPGLLRMLRNVSARVDSIDRSAWTMNLECVSLFGVDRFSLLRASACEIPERFWRWTLCGKRQSIAIYSPDQGVMGTTSHTYGNYAPNQYCPRASLSSVSCTPLSSIFWRRVVIPDCFHIHGIALKSPNS